MKERKFFGVSKNIFYTGLTSFLTDTATKMVYSVMPMFLLSIGASKTSLSLIEGIAESTSALIKSFSGFWSDKIGKNKPFMLLGYGLSAIIMPLYAFVGAPVHVLYLRFVERVGKGLRAAPRDSIIAASAGKDTGKSFGVQKSMDNMGAILGPVIAFVLLRFFPENYRLIFLLSAIPAFFGVMAIIFGVKDARKEPSQRLKSFKLKDLPGKYYLFLGIIFLFTLGNSTDALLLVKANEVGVKVAFVPLVYLISSVVSVALAVPMGTLSDRAGKGKMLIIGYIIYAIVYFGFGRTSNVGMILGLFALYGLYSSLTDGIQKAFISDMIGKNIKGTGMGIYNTLMGLTLLPASLIAGWLYDNVNSSVPFYFGACTAAGAAILMTILTFSKKKQHDTL